MIKQFNLEENLILASVIDGLETLVDCAKFRQVTDWINIHTLNDLAFESEENRQIVSKGFGALSIRDYGFSGKSVAVVINTENCKKGNLTEREIAAVVLHELGHLLNEPEPEQEPTVSYCFMNGILFSWERLESVKAANQTRNEVYADLYAKRYGYGAELISTFDKQNEFFDQKIGGYAERVEMLQISAYLEGKISSHLRYNTSF